MANIDPALNTRSEELEADLLRVLEEHADEAAFWPAFAVLAEDIRIGRADAAEYQHTFDQFDFVLQKACVARDCWQD